MIRRHENAYTQHLLNDFRLLQQQYWSLRRELEAKRTTTKDAIEEADEKRDK